MLHHTLPLSCAFFLLDHLGHVHGPCNQSSAFDPSKVGQVSIQYASHVTLFRQPALQCNLSNREVDKLGLKPGRLDGLGCEWEQETWQMALHKGDDPGFLGFMNQLKRMQCQGLKHQSKHHHLHTKRQDYNVDNGHHTTTETWIELYAQLKQLIFKHWLNLSRIAHPYAIIAINHEHIIWSQRLLSNPMTSMGLPTPMHVQFANDCLGMFQIFKTFLSHSILGW